MKWESATTLPIAALWFVKNDDPQGQVLISDSDEGESVCCLLVLSSQLYTVCPPSLEKDRDTKHKQKKPQTDANTYRQTDAWAH